MNARNPRANPYTGSNKKFNPHSLCGTDQPNSHFTDQVQDRPMRDRPVRFVIPKTIRSV